MREDISVNLVCNPKNEKGLREWVLVRMTERIRNEAFIRALGELKRKYIHLKSGVILDPKYVGLSDEEERKVYQPEYENLVASHFIRITENAIDIILGRAP